MSQWYNFYKDRINSGYQAYFEERYKPFLDMIAAQKPHIILELGCGIASISKFFKKKGIACTGFDLCPNMVALAKRNVGHGAYFQGDIFSDKRFIDTNITCVSHGVLEHFTDEQIKTICRRYPNSIHYVPLDGYSSPSFGDERLLPYQHWLDLVQPKEYIIFNDGCDLAFKL